MKKKKNRIKVKERNIATKIQDGTQKTPPTQTSKLTKSNQRKQDMDFTL